MRVAKSLGVHVNGSRLGLDPFETETRRRLWWHLTALDATAPENHGFNSTSVDNDHTLFLPNNIDDVDMSLETLQTPIGKGQWTEMSFSILNMDLCRRLRHTVTATTKDDNDTKSNLIDKVERIIRQKWLDSGDLMLPTCRAADALLKISILKAHFIFTLQAWLSNTPNTESKYSQIHKSTLTTAMKLLEDGYLLQSGKLLPDFAWFFQQQPQLYALFLVLRTLGAFPDHAEADSPWLAVDNYFTCLTELEEANELKGRTSCFWAVLGPLYEKVKKSHFQSRGVEPEGVNMGKTGIQINVDPSLPLSTAEPNDSMPLRTQLALEQQ
ncbi:Neuraminidase [Penicillium atrosanguineum]|uniref:Neuraminidase n=1 Tax=Penicillium atrosanguineum TaxID=1132637 RepID=UPI00238DEE14|nr:Neuraminidase [Penicillium atrosanguineum]KAJ5292766.1 Neuraminidase [Penicillium atrosanguineum]